MTEQIKAWAVVNQYDKVGGLWFDKERAQQDVNLDANAFHLVELTSTPKIKMTQAEWDEFKLIKKEYEDGPYIIFGVLNGLNNSFTHCVWSKMLFSSDLPNKERDKHMEHFIKLLTSDNPEELVEIEKENRYELVLNLDDEQVWNGSVLVDRDGYQKTFTQSAIDELGGDDWLAEMGLTAVEVTE